MKWQQLILAFISSIGLIFAGKALAQTNLNINNTNLFRFGGSIEVLAFDKCSYRRGFFSPKCYPALNRAFEFFQQIGHPFNVPQPWTVVSGEVINYNAQSPEMSIDATVAAGNSGGPVINDKGEMIGMMVSIYNRGDVAVDPNVATPALLDNTAATGGVGLAYRTEVILQQLKAWGYEL